MHRSFLCGLGLALCLAGCAKQVDGIDHGAFLSTDPKISTPHKRFSGSYPSDWPDWLKLPKNTYVIQTMKDHEIAILDQDGPPHSYHLSGLINVDGEVLRRWLQGKIPSEYVLTEQNNNSSHTFKAKPKVKNKPEVWLSLLYGPDVLKKHKEQGPWVLLTIDVFQD